MATAYRSGEAAAGFLLSSVWTSVGGRSSWGILLRGWTCNCEVVGGGPWWAYRVVVVSASHRTPSDNKACLPRRMFMQFLFIVPHKFWILPADSQGHWTAELSGRILCQEFIASTAQHRSRT